MTADLAAFAAAAAAGTLTDRDADRWLLQVTAPKTSTVPGCPHQPPCPAADQPNHDAAVEVACHHEQGWIQLCNGVILFDDAGELVPDDSDDGGPCHCHAEDPHRPEPRHKEN